MIQAVIDTNVLVSALLARNADPSDAVFYEVALSKDGAYLVTGNIRHFPKNPIVVTPAEMMRILAGAGRSH